MSSFLEEIAGHTRRRVEALQASRSLAQIKTLASRAGRGLPFAGTLKRPGRVALIAELKQASPSAGLIRQESDYEGRLRKYKAGGASALSILTEEEYFRGSPRFLERARSVVEIPLLRKDFILEAYQLFESRSLGADATLLIVALLGNRLRDFIRWAEDAGVESLVEVHQERELDEALEAGARLIGINNRNLHTLQVDPATSERLAPRVPKDCIWVIESGIKEPSDMARCADLGAHAVLIGEALMRSENPEALVKAFVEAGKRSS